MNEGVRQLGVTDLENSHERSEKMFRMTADDAAEVILRGAQKNERGILVGAGARIYDKALHLVPGRYQWLLVRASRFMPR
ncbi:MAG: hypothetical protein KF819_35750 [Labilithrix sp.]|nr:hypothetical protein [Labilithrix sp.]